MFSRCEIMQANQSLCTCSSSEFLLELGFLLKLLVLHALFVRNSRQKQQQFAGLRVSEEVE